MILKFKKRGEVKLKTTQIEWLTLSLIFGCYLVWIVAGLAYQSYPFAALIVVPICGAFFSSLQHEALHGHPTRKAKLNEALVFFPISLLYPYRRYKTLHLRHHADERLTDPYDDPESYYRAFADWARLPNWIKASLDFNNTFIGRIALGPAIAVTGFLGSEFRLRNKPSVRLAWLLHFLGLIPVLVIVHCLFEMPILLYALLSYVSLSILAIRSFCEHQWSEHADGRTVIVEKSILGLLFLNNNLHLVHHKQPTAAWNTLPKLYNDHRDEWKQLNNGYVFRSYLDVLKAFATRVKEPVVHPVYGDNL